MATGRKTSKSLNCDARIIRKSIAYGKHTRLSERMFVAPASSRSNPILQRVHSKIQANPRFLVLDASSNKYDGILKWHTIVIYHWWIDGTVGDDRNIVALRVDEIIFDDAAFTVRACNRVAPIAVCASDAVGKWSGRVLCPWSDLFRNPL